MTLRSITLYSNKGSKGRANAVPAPRFRAFGMEPLRVSTLTGFNRISQGWHA